ncbi:hypothetical protein VZ95_19430 [Elstera litoralis]|uniref:Uncharacterized protein n=2 Tax=Elstera litoralis TaxID=552518 RepID=A0A0F3IRG9_9PROT|nr:hypothetical protein VZ95_19430 [Elstera litoralis]
MVLPWRITALLLALLPALAQPAVAGEFSAEEQKLVADIRQKMDQTTQLLIYTYENEEKMDLAEMQRVMVGFRELAKWFENKIPDRTFERRTGSFCVGSASFASSYWRNTEYYYKYKGSEDGKYVGAPRTLKELKDRQKDLLEGHFFDFQQCYIHLDQVPTRLEDKESAPKISITAIPSIRTNSLKLVQNIQDKMTSHYPGDFAPLIKKADTLYKNYYSISDLKIGGGLLCENFVDFPKHFIENYILRHGKNSKNQKLPESLFKIGYDGLLHNYYRDVKLCDNFVKEYKRKSP